jgi:cytidyltransferase-like protein
MTPAGYGAVLGRFQPLHLGHLEYLVAAKSQCHRLVIGITNPDVFTMTFEPSNPIRSERAHNPFPYFVRHEMIERALCEEGWSRDSFAIVPANINDIAHVSVFLPPRERTTVFVTIYDAWGEEKLTRLQAIGFDTRVLWRRKMSERLTTGGHVRDLMRNDGAWESLVPKGVSRFFEAESWALKYIKPPKTAEPEA